jgi:transposase
MSPVNRYYRRSRIPEGRFLKLLRYFALDRSATEAANLTGLTRKSVTNIFLKLRRRIAEECERRSPLSTSDLNQKEEFSWTRCVCGRCQTKVSPQSPVFSVLTDSSKIFTVPGPDCRKPILRALVRGRVTLRAIPAKGGHGYDALVDAAYSQPFMIRRKMQPADTNVLPTKRIKSFWNFARRRLEKFNGVPNRTFYLHLKETEWRFNVGKQDLYRELIRLIETNPL